MLGVTGILVGVVFLTSIFLQTVLGFSALETGLAFLPFALAITAGTLVARHLLAHASPRAVATFGLLVRPPPPRGCPRPTAGRGSPATYSRPWSPSGSGSAWCSCPVSVTSMTGIPASHSGVASGFLMTGHEIGAALGVAVLSAVAGTAGTLTTAEGAADAFSRGLTEPPSSALRRRGRRSPPDVGNESSAGGGATCTSLTCDVGSACSMPAGGMWWLPRSRSVGSYCALIARSRTQVSASKSLLASVADSTKFGYSPTRQEPSASSTSPQRLSHPSRHRWVDHDSESEDAELASQRRPRARGRRTTSERPAHVADLDQRQA